GTAARIPTTAPNVVHIAPVRAERTAAYTARFMALFYQLEPANHMIRDMLRGMVENRRPQ
ncbi:MAG TPA: hypothetical protein VEN78_27220, partial [Bradyrhizobium sp.]|nr:hypothetical protein [Bradyrhizobium sp.]